ncbi:cytidine deaminase [Candidatus Neomarinimicrobiota bacterium]
MEELVKTAIKMRALAHAPYSDYSVGAAVITEDGSIFGGCNVESSSYSLTCCAERVAIFNAITSGYKNFEGLAVATENGSPPCGACRQVIWDLCSDIPIFICDSHGAVSETTSKILLPDAFGAEHLS